jgi:hypothetical protein
MCGLGILARECRIMGLESSISILSTFSITCWAPPLDTHLQVCIPPRSRSGFSLGISPKLLCLGRFPM